MSGWQSLSTGFKFLYPYDKGKSTLLLYMADPAIKSLNLFTSPFIESVSYAN
jgi:hypothetical protein